MKNLGVFVLFLGFFGCSGKDAETGNGAAPQPEWVVTHSSTSDDGTVKVVQSHLDAESEKLMQQGSTRSNLIELGIDAKYNARVFRITDETIADYQNKVFVLPKVFSYGSQDGGKLAPIQNSDGTTTLAFNVAWVDGVNQTIQSPSADTKTTSLPESFLVQNQDELKEILQSQYGANNGLAPLPGCPERVTIVTPQQTYDATPAEFIDCDSFELNTPMVFSLKVPKAFADYLLYQGLYAGLVDICASYAVRVSYPVSSVKISFDRSKIYEDLQAELKVSTAFLAADAKLAVTKVVQNQLAKVAIQGDPGDLANKLIERVTAEFFEPFIPSPENKIPECPSATVCLNLSYQSVAQSSTLDFSWVQATNTMTKAHEVMVTKLKPTPPTSNIGKEFECTVDCHPLSNRDAPRETNLTVVQGNQLTIEPLYSRVEQKALPVPTVTRNSNIVCLRSHQPLCGGGNPHEGFGRPRFEDQVFELAEANACPAVCDQSEDHWIQTTSYSQTVPRIDKEQNPTGLIQQLYDGLILHFTWMDQATGEKKDLPCPIADFTRIGTGGQLEVKLENSTICHPFSNVPQETPALYIENKLNFPVDYLLGALVTTWDGRVISQPVNQTFYPEISLGLKLTLKGLSFVGE